MISVLFSLSEGKRHGGSLPALQSGGILFGLDPRNEILEAYRSIVLADDPERYLLLFGLKKEADAEPYLLDILTAPTLPALERYDGVAYEYLDAASLDGDALAYLGLNLIIFSNLFGPLRGSDAIPDYKLKQGNQVGGIAPESYYRTRFQENLDELLGDRQILDLRAGYYDKFYKPGKTVTTMKFIKDGKVVSHWAKAYRGIVLRHQAQHRFQTTEALLASDIPGLRIKEIQQKRGKTEAIFDILT